MSFIKNKIKVLFLSFIILFALLPCNAFAEGITVTVGVFDYTAVSYGTQNASETGIILDNISIAVPVGGTALDAFTAAFTQEGISCSLNAQYNYITSVNNLSEKDCGEQSGWMFSINDDFANMGAASSIVSDNDSLKLHYSIYGWGTDVGNYFSAGPAVTKLTLGEAAADISNHNSSYYIGDTPLVGDGSALQPYIIPIELPFKTDLTALTAEIESTLHPKYISYSDELTDISKPCDYTSDVSFCLQTTGGFKKTFYTIKATTVYEPPVELDGDWTSYRGNCENMGITPAKTPQNADEAYLKWAVKYSNDWSEAITSPILLNDYIYIAKNNRIVQIDPENGNQLAESDVLAGSIGYGLSNITYGGGMLFVPVGNGKIQALRADNLISLWVSEELGGQTLTPVTYKDGFIYSGTWNGEKSDGTFFCIQTADEDIHNTAELKNCRWKITHMGGFYGTGAAAKDNCIIFGSDDGSDSSFSETAVLYSVSPENGSIIDSIDNIKGDIRCSIAYDSKSDCAYFASKSGELYCVKVNADGTFGDLKSISLGGMVTGTPVVYDGLLYAGISGENVYSSEGHLYKIIDADTMQVKAEAKIPGYPQASALLSCAYDKNFIYTTYNYTPGGIYVIEAEKSGENILANSSPLFTPVGDMAQYCLCSPICDKNGTIYYKNDSGYIMAIARTLQSENKITSFNINTYEGIIDEANKTISVTVAYETNLLSLTPEITVSKNASVTPVGNTDFTSPVIYTVTAENGSMQKYTVTITKQSGGGGNNSGISNSSAVLKKDNIPVKFTAFTDISSHWAKAYIEHLADKGIISGKTETEFAPEDEITRAEFLTLLYRISGNSFAPKNMFSDVSENDWYASAVTWAVENNITQGISENKFAPNISISREQAAVFITRFFTDINPDKKDLELSFADSSDISPWAAESVKTMVQAGILSGRENNQLKPQDSITRAETAKILAVILTR